MVVFPAPFGPISAKIEPLLTLKETPLRALIPPKFKESPLISRNEVIPFYPYEYHADSI
jgi:hypothetical protein